MIEYKEATMEDYPRFGDMIVNIVKHANYPFSIAGETSINNYAKDYIRNPDGFCYIADDTDNGLVVGWIAGLIAPYPFSDEAIMQIQGWDTHPKYWGRGIGSKLLEMATKEGKARGCPVATIGVNKDSSPEPERAFGKLERAGFHEFERTYYYKLT